MTRVLVISQLPPPIHGSTVMTGVLLDVLNGIGHEIVFVTRTFSASVAEVGKFRIRKVFAAIGLGVRLVRAMILRRPKISIFFVTTRTFSFLVDWALSELLRFFPLRRINYVHTLGFSALAERGRVFEWMVARLLRSADATVLLGSALFPDVEKWVKQTSITYIPNCVDAPVDEEVATSKATSRLLFLSNLIPDKGVGTFIDLAASIAPDFPEVDFWVAGETFDAEFTSSLKRIVLEKDLESKLKFLGPVKDDQTKWRLLRDATLLIFPSTYQYETFGLVLAESMAVGTPVVAYRTGALVPSLEAAFAGAAVDVGDVLGLERKVRELLMSRETVQRMGANALELFERDYAREKFSQRWDALLTEMNRS